MENEEPTKPKRRNKSNKTREMLALVDGVKESDLFKHLGFTRNQILTFAINVLANNLDRIDLAGNIITTAPQPKSVGRPPRLSPEQTAEENGRIKCSQLGGTVDSAGMCTWINKEVTPTGRLVETRMSKHVSKL